MKLFSIFLGGSLSYCCPLALVSFVTLSRRSLDSTEIFFSYNKMKRAKYAKEIPSFFVPNGNIALLGSYQSV